MDRIVNYKQNTPEWLEFRRSSLGATTASVLSGENPWKNEFDLYEEMVLGKVTPLNDAMKRGMEMEDEARGFCEMELECALFPVTMKHKTIPFMHASFDGISLDEKIAVEIKCSKKCYDDAVKDKIPSYYKYQMFQQMLIGNLNSMYYCAYWEGKGKMIRLQFDLGICSEIELNAINFYENHIRTKCPPQTNKPKKKPVNTLDNDSIVSLEINLRNRAEIVAKIKHLEDLKKYLDENIIAECKGESREVGDFKITRYDVRGPVDYGSIPMLNGIDLEQYRKPDRTQWKIS